MHACTRYNRHQTTEGQYKPVMFDSTAVLLRHTANTPSTLAHAPYQGSTSMLGRPRTKRACLHTREAYSWQHVGLPTR